MTPSGAGHSISEFLARKVTHADQQALGPAGSDEPKIERWTAQRKAAIVLDVLKVKISVPEACRKYGFPQGEFRCDGSQTNRSSKALPQDIACPLSLSGRRASQQLAARPFEPVRQRGDSPSRPRGNLRQTFA
jgi:hypothetical protein